MGRPATCDCGTCRKCKRRVYMRDYYHRFPDRARQHARATRQRHLEEMRARDRERGFRPGDPVKIKARRKVTTALQNGSLVRQPCEVCGSTKVQAHHDDYSKPLDVRWLCTTHHGELHRSVAA